MALDLFPFVNTMFTNPRDYENIKNADKGRHTFMVNRFFSIKFPTTAQSLNRNGINGWAVVDLWQIVASRFGKVPFWIYTKTKKAPSEKVWKPNPEVANLWMERNGLGPSDLDFAIKFNPEEMKKSFASIEKQIQLYDK
jgi:hypothetical protein